MSSAKSNKGKPIRILDGHTMFLHYAYASSETEYWRCSKYTTCPARAKLVALTGEFKLNTDSQHNHLPYPTSPLVN